MTDRGQIIAKLSGAVTAEESPYPVLEAPIREGLATRGDVDDPNLYPKRAAHLKWDEVEHLLDGVRANRHLDTGAL